MKMFGIFPLILVVCSERQLAGAKQQLTTAEEKLGTVNRWIEAAQEEGNVRDRRQVENRLEYVLSVLQERGLLSQVDPQLLNKAQRAVQTSKQAEQEQVQEQEIEEENNREKLNRDIYSASRQRVLNSRLGIINRDQSGDDILENSRQTNDDIQQNGRRSFWDTQTDQRKNGLRKDEGECQALKTENQLLKQMLVRDGSSNAAALRAEDGVAGPITALRVLQQLQESESNLSPVFVNNPALDLLTGSTPLDLLNEGTGERLLRGVAEETALPEFELRSVLITPTPTLSTVYQTTSLVTTVTVNVTKEIGIHVHGRRIVTSLYDTEIQVLTTTETVTSTVEVTPTPTWSTYTHTNTQTQTHRIEDDFQQPIRVLDQFQQTTDPVESPRKLTGFQIPFKGIRAEVVEIPENLDSFISLQEILRRIKEQKTDPPPVQPATPVPETPTLTTPIETTSIMTVFLSGSKPGEYTTTLRTITLGSSERRKRQVHPSPPSQHSPILQTQSYNPGLLSQALINELVSDSASVIELEGSMINPTSSLGSIQSMDCPEVVTVTVTVTENSRSP